MTYDERRLEEIAKLNERARERSFNKKQKLKEEILFALIVGIIVAGSIKILNCQLEQAADKCSQKHDKNYCIKKLR